MPPTTPKMPKARKPRKKMTTDLGKSILQRERHKLAQEQAALEERLAQEAAQARRMAQIKAREEKTNESKKIEVAFERSVVRRLAGVLASEGVRPKFEIEAIHPSQGVDAWTDFHRIHIGYHMLSDIRLTAAVVRGEGYHEGGHMRFTVPFVQLHKMVVEAITVQLRAEGMADTIRMDDEVNARLQALGQGHSFATLQKAWNGLEDQRMEMAVVTDSPRKAGYFHAMMLSELAHTVNAAAANWPLMVWRQYLPSKVVAGARRLFVIKNGPRGEQYARDIERIVNTYVLSSDAIEMYNAVANMATMYTFITPVLYNMDVTHGRQSMGKADIDPNALIIPIEPMFPPEPVEDEPVDVPESPKVEWTLDDLDDEEVEHVMEVLAQMLTPENLLKIQYVLNVEGDEVESGTTPQSGDTGDDEEDEDEDEDEEQPSQEGADSQSAPKGDMTGSGSTDADSEDEGEGDLTQEDLNDAIEKAEEERDSDRTLDQDVDSFQEALEISSALAPYTSGDWNDDGVMLSTAENLADELYYSFMAATADRAPSWQEQQRRGILNVMRYETRRPGEVEVFRSYEEGDDPGCDIAVSLMLDYSGSMDWAERDLSKAAYACKTACDRLGIPCTVTLWGTGVKLLWEGLEKADRLPVIKADGGTDPRRALEDLDNQGHNKVKHIVLIMTDDQWGSAVGNMLRFRRDGRTIIGVGFSKYGEKLTKMAESLRSKGADEAYGIDTLSDLPRHLQETLAAMA